MVRKGKGPAVVCDFDDTTVLENVAEMLLKEFGGEGWKEYQRLNVRHKMTLKEYQERAFQTVKVGREAMKDHVKENATLRPHFKALYEYCVENGIPLAIATMGLDFYVEALLEREGMESVECYAADTEFTEEGIRYEYPYASEECWQPGTCKCAVLERYRKMGHSVILFAGDGKTDICPADRSDVVFARRYLEEHREEKGLPFVRLTDFEGMVRMLREMGGEKEEDGIPPSREQEGEGGLDSGFRRNDDGGLRGKREEGGDGLPSGRDLQNLPASPSATPVTSRTAPSPSPPSSPRMGEEGGGGGEAPPSLLQDSGQAQSSPVKGEEVRGRERPPGPTRFFVAGPPQNDICECGGRGKRRGDGLPPSREKGSCEGGEEERMDSGFRRNDDGGLRGKRGEGGDGLPSERALQNRLDSPSATPVTPRTTPSPSPQSSPRMGEEGRGGGG